MGTVRREPLRRRVVSLVRTSRLRASVALALVGTLGLVGCAPLETDVASAGPGSPTTGPTATTTERPAPADDPSTPRATATPEPTTPTPGTSSSDAPTALAALALLEVKGRAPKTGYDRELFGYRSVDLDRNGCDTRNDVLRRDLVDQAVRPDGCVVESGTLHDPYTGATIAFVRGQGTSAAVQIDHVVALSDAWQKGAQQWDAATREAFGNDPLNLLAVDGPANQGKGAGDAATWLPPHRAFRCAYVARQVAVKRAYGLWVTAAERDAIARVLAACPDEPLPAVDGALRPAQSSAAPSSGPSPAAPTTEARPPAAGDDVYYASCAEARAAGAAPLHRGEPGYRSGLDGDDDGIACEG